MSWAVSDSLSDNLVTDNPYDTTGDNWYTPIVSVTSIDKKGQETCFPESKVETYWTNLVKRRRIKSMLQDIIYSACKYVASGNAKIIKFGIDSKWWQIIDRQYLKYS